jgi:hypothetical protein
MTDDDATMTLELDQLNGERAVLRDGSTSLTISRARWDELGRPAALQVLLNPDRA